MSEEQRDYKDEAYAIMAGTTMRQPEKAHLLALLKHFQELYAEAYREKNAKSH